MGHGDFLCGSSSQRLPYERRPIEKEPWGETDPFTIKSIPMPENAFF